MPAARPGGRLLSSQWAVVYNPTYHRKTAEFARDNVTVVPTYGSFRQLMLSRDTLDDPWLGHDWWLKDVGGILAGGLLLIPCSE